MKCSERRDRYSESRNVQDYSELICWHSVRKCLGIRTALFKESVQSRLRAWSNTRRKIAQSPSLNLKHQRHGIKLTWRAAGYVGRSVKKVSKLRFGGVQTMSTQAHSS